MDMYLEGIIIALMNRFVLVGSCKGVGVFGLGRLLLDLLLALDHDHGQEGEDDGQAKDEEHAGDANRVFSWREVGVQEVCLVHERLYP